MDSSTTGAAGGAVSAGRAWVVLDGRWYTSISFRPWGDLDLNYKSIMHECY